MKILIIECFDLNKRKCLTKDKSFTREIMHKYHSCFIIYEVGLDKKKKQREREKKNVFSVH